MIKCPSCRTDNLDGSQFCDECGTALNAGRQFNQPPYFQPAEYNPPAEFVPPSSNDYESPPPPNFVSASVTSVGVPAFVEEEFDKPADEMQNADFSESDKKNVHSSLLIERGTAIGAEFDLTSDESNIGRWDADNGIFPDVDLDAHDPEAKVSRRHARIVRADGRFYIEDLGSTNGTFVNRGRRLLPGNRQSIEDGDEIIVGKTFLRFRINR